MSKTTLQNWLINNEGFKLKYNSLLLESISNQFSKLKNNYFNLEPINWEYMLLCASILAQSNKEECQSVSLRIVNFCIESKNTNVIEKDAAAVILDSLGNKPTIELAEKRELIEKNYIERLSFSFYQEWTRRSIENSIILFNNSYKDVNRFQKKFWESVKNYDWISISAPTSAGKSYILELWLTDFINKNKNSIIVYIVPTRALISQVQKDITHILHQYDINEYSITTLPMQSSLQNEKVNILIFTQERFHIFLSENNIPISLLIIDEAHKIGDNYRGVLLQHAIETASYNNFDCKVVFASPMTDNPELLLEDSPLKLRKKFILSEDITVNQNLFWVSQETGNPKNWNIEYVSNDKTDKIGSITLENLPNPESKRLPFIAYELCNREGGNVIYANLPSEAEKMAIQMYDLKPDFVSDSEAEEINQLIDLIKKVIHPKYTLVNTLTKGIAFHYGNMPLLIREEIENLFNKGIIKFLICTSTLLEGVNMPCQNLFVRGPSKGRGKPMNENDFWNLAGRAGRWGKEFQGNIFCIDVNLERIWKNGPPKRRKKYPIKRTSDSVINNPDFIKYLEEKAPKEISLYNPSYEYVFSYLSSVYARNGNLKNCNWSARFNSNIIESIENNLVKIFDDINIPNEIILKNPGISPLAMNDLLFYFTKRTETDKKQIEDLLPVPPDSENSLVIYIQILHRINRYLGNVFSRRVNQLALLIIEWMKGYPLARIINSRESYYKRNNIVVKLEALIRDTMSDVEDFARFKAPKYLSCYSDILKFYLTINNRKDLIDRMLEMHILLEFGVSHKTQLSLLGIGLSRSSSIILSEIIAKDSLNENEVINWLKSNNWIIEEMPELIKIEISNVIQKK